MSLRVVFLGNHTVGVRALAGLLDIADVQLVVAHPPDPEDGVRYESLHDDALDRSLPVVRSSGRNPELASRIAELAPDVIWTTDYRYLLPPEVLAAASMACVNLHPSLLPKYRGRAALNWAIINGETEVGLTAHLMDEGIDTGPILKQVRLPVAQSDDIGDVLEQLQPIYEDLSRTLIGELESGAVQPKPQPAGDWPIWPRRVADDGTIDWNASAHDIVNLIRAVSAPYPGARTSIDGREVMVWKAMVEPSESAQPTCPGRIDSVGENCLIVESGQGCVRITQWSATDAHAMLCQKACFESRHVDLDQK